MLLTDGTVGAVKSVNVSPMVSLGAATASQGQTITSTVGGISGTASAPLSKASTAAYGVTKFDDGSSANIKTRLEATKVENEQIVYENYNNLSRDLAVSPAYVQAVIDSDKNDSPVVDYFTIYPNS